MSSCWSPLRTVAQTQVNGWRVELDPNRPAQGLVISKLRGPRWEAMSIQPLPSHTMVAEEIYIRQQDLIVRFGQAPQDQYGFQIDWRILDPLPSFRVGVEVWISIQTQLLDTAPSVSVASRSDSAWTAWSHRDLADKAKSSTGQLGSTGLLEHPAAWSSQIGGTSCLWLIDPRDQSQLTWRSAPSDTVQQADLFGDFLEKGVIRRARMQLWVGPKNIQPKQVQRVYQQLMDRNLPLTA